MRSSLCIALLMALSIVAAAPAPAPAAAASHVAAAVLDIDWANLNSTSLAAVDPASFLTITVEQLASIPASACTGFQQAQLANTGSTAGSAVCGGFQADCFSNITSLYLQALSVPCAAVIQPLALGAITDDQAHFMPSTACGAFNASQSAALGPQCGSFTPACLTAWNVASVPGFQFGCISVMGPDRIAAFSSDQIGAIDPTAVIGIQGWNCGSMTTGCGGFTAAQFSGMLTSAWRNWSPACVAAFTPAGLGGWTRAQMRSFPVTQFWTWSLAQVAGLSPQGFAGIDPASAKGLPPALCAAFHAPQIAAFQDFYTQHVCEQWSMQCLSLIPPAEFAGWREECTQRLRPDALSNVTRDQVSFFDPNTFFVLSPQQLAAFPTQACAGITPAQMQLFDYAFPSVGCQGFSGACLSQLSDDALGALAPTCAAHLSAAAFGALSATQVAALPDEDLAYVSGAALATLDAAHCGQLSAEKLEALEAAYPPTLVTQLSPACLGALTGPTCGAISGAFFSAFNQSQQLAKLASLSATCVSALPCSALLSTPWSLLQSLDPELQPHVSSALTACYTPAACEELNPASMSSLQDGYPESLIASLSPSCLSSLSLQACSTIDERFLAAFNDTGSISKLANLNATCVEALSCATLVATPVEWIQALNYSDAAIAAAAACTTPVGPAGDPDSSPESRALRIGLVLGGLALVLVVLVLLVCKFRAAPKHKRFAVPLLPNRDLETNFIQSDVPQPADM